MTASEVAVLTNSLAPIVREASRRAATEAIAPLLERLAVLEARSPMKGEKGERGDPGQDGLDGERGQPGADGKPGEIGPRGEKGDKGEDGQPGAAGRNGDKGERGEKGEPGRDGRDGLTPDVAAIAAEIKAQVLAAVIAAIPPPVKGDKGEPGRDGADGKDGLTPDMGVLAAEVRTQVLASLPPPVRGEKGERGDPGRDGQDGRPGTDWDPVAVEAMVTMQAERLLAAWPKPKDGERGERGLPGEMGPRGDIGPPVAREAVEQLVVAEVQRCLPEFVTKAVAALPVPVSVTGSVLDRSGQLVLTRSDGSTLLVGQVVGRDGKDVDEAEVARLIERTLAAWPRPKDGANGQDGKDGQDGKNGADGLGFDDIGELEIDGEGRWFLPLRRGEQVRRIRLPLPAYRGIFKVGTRYDAGDYVTKAGSLWCAREATEATPGNGETPWQLCAKSGADGKRGEKGEKGDPGRDGRNGRDLTQMDSEGRKW